MKDVLKCVLMRPGEQCVTTPGTPLMPVLFVHSWDTQDSVRHIHNSNFNTPGNSFLFPIVDATAYPGGRFGQGTGPIFVDNSGCGGNEPRLLSCGYDTHTADCTHAEDAGLRCSGRREFVPSLFVLYFTVL